VHLCKLHSSGTARNRRFPNINNRLNLFHYGFADDYRRNGRSRLSCTSDAHWISELTSFDAGVRCLPPFGLNSTARRMGHPGLLAIQGQVAALMCFRCALDSRAYELRCGRSLSPTLRAERHSPKNGAPRITGESGEKPVLFSPNLSSSCA
jgi:hypothetical protein